MRTTSIRLCALIAAAAGLASASCKKNDEPAAVTSEDRVGVEGRRATEPRRTTQPRGEPAAAENALATRYNVCVGHVNAGNWDRFRADCVTDDFVRHEIGGRDIRGPDGLIEQLKSMKSAFPDLKLQPQLVMVSGQNLLAMGLTTGTHQQPLKTPAGEVAATNKKMGQLFFHRLAITEDLKAKEEWLHSDMGTMLSQLGQLPKDAPAMRPPMTTGIEGAPIIAVTADDQKERTNLETVRRMQAAFSAHNMKDLVSLYADDAVVSDQAMSADFTGKKEIEKMYSDMVGGFSDAKVEVPSMFAAGDYVVAIGTFTGTNDGDLVNLKTKKTGKKVVVSYADVIQLRDGKIAKVWRFRDGMDMGRQLGTTTAPAQQDQPVKQQQPAKQR
jgi:steroid delta-isomerase-like uncharacterized protein